MQSCSLVNQDLLLFISMNSKGRPALLTKIFCNIVRNSLSGDKNKDLRIFCANLIKVFDQLVALFEVAANFNDLLDVVVCGQLHRTDIDLYHIPKEVLECDITKNNDKW